MDGGGTSFDRALAHQAQSWVGGRSPMTVRSTTECPTSQIRVPSGEIATVPVTAPPDQRSTAVHSAKSTVLGVLYGVINAILTIPCMYGYAAIIFGHPSFKDHRDQLSKLVLFSSAVHQIVFSLMSSLPFAIGQVQDAGLIFLSSMATSIAVTGTAKGWGGVSTLATVVISLAIATATLGLMLFLIGRARLASLVSYLPAPVVGGYLAFIGYFCLLAGINLCAPELVFTGRVGEDAESYRLLFMSGHAMLMCLPGLIGGVLLLCVSHKFAHFAALPATIVAMPVVFYVVLVVSGHSLDDARGAGWMDYPPPEQKPFWTSFEAFSFGDYHPDVLPSLVPTWLGMVFVVSFSSCLDVAAIEMDMGRQLKINHELSTIGISNVVSGLLGGYSGSYIFSQTLFTYRSQVHTRIVGVVVILCELGLFLVPVSIMAYVPRFFFAATLIFIAFDLLIEWIVLVSQKLLFREYLVLLCTFVLLNIFGLEAGMAIAVGVAMANFVFAYSRTSKRIVTKISKTSNVLASADERHKISEAHREICALELHGYLFFGSAVAIVDDVKRNLFVAEDTSSRSTAIYESGGKTAAPDPSLYVNSPSAMDRVVFSASKTTSPAQTSGVTSSLLSPLLPMISTVDTRVVSVLDLEKNGGTTSRPAPSGVLPTRVLILDFSRVTGMDATAVRSCFMVLNQICRRFSVQILVCGTKPEVSFLLRRNGLASWNPGKLGSINDALRQAEGIVTGDSTYLTRPRHYSISSLQRSLGDTPTTGDNPAWAHGGMLVTSLLSMARCGKRVAPDEARLLRDIEAFFDIVGPLTDGHRLFSAGDAADAIYIVKSGQMVLAYPETMRGSQTVAAAATAAAADAAAGVAGDDQEDSCTVRVGFIFGESDFFLAQPRHLSATASGEGTSVFRLTSDSLSRMEAERPKLRLLADKLFIRILSRQVSWARKF